MAVSIDELIREYHELPLDFNPAATEAELRTLQRRIGVALPVELIALYRDHNGAAPQATPALRFMSTDEVRAFHAATAEHLWTELGVRYFWTDDNSNYAGVYLDGPLTGRVTFLDHEEPDLSPCYRSVGSFLRAHLLALEGGLSHAEMAREYPEMRDVHSPDLEDDFGLAKVLEERFERGESDELKRFYAFAAMALTPPRHTDALLRFLDLDDMWIPERCCEIVGVRRYEPAIPRLIELTKRFQPNTGTAAVLALGKIGTPACVAALLDVAPQLPPESAGIVGTALQECGCDVEHDEGRWRVKLPGEAQWRVLR